MEGFIKELVTFIVWMVANVVYQDARRRNRRGFLRFLSFWMGMPVTILSMIFVREGSQPDLVPPPDDEEALLDEIRRARRLPAGEGDANSTPDSGPDPLEGA